MIFIYLIVKKEKTSIVKNFKDFRIVKKSQFLEFLKTFVLNRILVDVSKALLPNQN